MICVICFGVVSVFLNHGYFPEDEDNESRVGDHPDRAGALELDPLYLFVFPSR